MNKLSSVTNSSYLTLLPHPLYENLKTHLQHLLLHAFPTSHRSLQSLHALIITLGFHFFDQPIFISNNLITSYVSFDQLSTARKVFDQMPERNSVSYNSIITAYARHDHGEREAWKLFSHMMGSGFRPTQFTFGSLLASASLQLFQGLQLHSMILKTGLLDANAVSGTALIGLFGRVGDLDMAIRLFDEMPHRNLVTWNSMISLFGRHGFVEESFALFCDLLRVGFHPSESSFVGVLSSLGEFELAEQVHGMVIKTGLEVSPSLSNSLINVYAKCSSMSFVEKLFKLMPVRDMASWNTIIGAFGRNGRPEKALEMFEIMPWSGFMPSQTTFAIVISLCASFENSKYGELIHAKAIKMNLQSDVLVGTALVDFYAKCGHMEHANNLFVQLEARNAVSWNALIAGHLVKDSRISVYLLKQMFGAGYRPNECTFSAVLKMTSIQELQQLHCLIVTLGYHEDTYVLSSLIASYKNNGLISDALTLATTISKPSLPTVLSNIIAGINNSTGQYQETKRQLSQLEHHDIVSWNILIEANVRSRAYKEAFEHLKDMQLAGILPDNYTAMSLLSMSTKLCNLALGRIIHGLLVKMNFKLCDIFVCNVLVDMYAKCGSLESSVKVFNEMIDRNLITWTAIISGLGLHGYAPVALDKFKEMESLGLKPDAVAFIAVLSACRHGGLMEEGMNLFERMKGVYGIEPEMDHYVCVVDLLARYGHLKEAERLISTMPFQPNAIIWRTFLEGCRQTNSGVGNMKFG